MSEFRTKPPIEQLEDDQEGLEQEDGEKPESKTVEPELSTAAKEEIGDRRQESHQRADNGLVIDFLREIGIDDADPMIIQLFDAALKEKYKDRAKSPESWEETKRLLQEMKPVFAGLDQQITALTSKEGFSKVKEKQKEIIHALCEMTLNGHLTADDVSSSVSKVVIRPTGNVASSTRRSQGYDSLMTYNPSTRVITISESALADVYMKVDSDTGRKTIFNLNLRHMINHELSHGLVEFGLVSDEDMKVLGAFARGEKSEIKGSPAILQIRKIIDSAKAMEGFQTQQAIRALRTLDSIDADYERLDEETKRQHSKEEFRRRREIDVANEILTDYTAAFLRSDGTQQSFFRRCVELTDPDLLADYLNRSMNASEGQGGIDRQGARANAQKQLSELCDAISRGNIGADEVASKYPGVKEMYDNYSIFFNYLKQRLADNKGKFADSIEKYDPEEGLESLGWNGHEGYGDRPRGQEGQSGGGSGIKDEVVAFLSAFGEEVGGGINRTMGA
ncbi:MAG: hypothetical protein BWY68_00242 [bacterium ADurb.Bin400]|nr:MAG: hypothetical protein BWY68_00242 [bacterium ADurb.Bin400]